VSEPRLTHKQKLFVEAYLANPNGTEAARVAGYKGDDAQLAVIASQNLKKLNIAEKVEERVSQAAMTADEVLAELADIAKADWREFIEIKYDKDGKVVDATLRLGDKIKALELVGKHHKLFTDKLEATGADGKDLIPKDLTFAISKIYGDGNNDNTEA